MAEASGTTTRILALLRLMAETPKPLGVKNVSDALGLPMSTSHRLLDSLVEAGFAEKVETGRRYRAGTEYLRIASLVARGDRLAQSIQPALDELAAQTGESAILGTYLPATRRMAYAAKCDSPQTLRYRIELHEALPLEWGATGLAILAHLPHPVQEAVLADSGPSPVTGDRLDRNTFFSRIAKVRRDGYALTRNEKIAESVGIAVALHSGPATVVGSLALTFPEFRFERGRTQDYVAMLQGAAHRFASDERDRPSPRR